MKWDVVVIGAGAAGMMCAAVAGQRGRKVLVLESAISEGAHTRSVRSSGHCRCFSKTLALNRIFGASYGLEATRLSR